MFPVQTLDFTLESRWLIPDQTSDCTRIFRGLTLGSRSRTSDQARPVSLQQLPAK